MNTVKNLILRLNLIDGCNTLNDLSNRVPNKTEDWNNDGGITVSFDVKNVMYVKKIIMFGILLHLTATIEIFSKYYRSFSNYIWWSYRVIDEERKTILTNFNEKKVACKTQNFDILLAFLLITIVLLIVVSIYCYLIKYQAKKKEKHLLPFQLTNNELK